MGFIDATAGYDGRSERHIFCYTVEIALVIGGYNSIERLYC